MGIPHLVRTGRMGVVGHFDALDYNCYPRDSRVIVRTDRGLESGEVICDLDASAEQSFPLSGQLLRLVSPEDMLILERLERFRDKAFGACERLIAERGLTALLFDVEHTFDGESVFFYFLGEITPELEALTEELGSVYERKVRFKKFSETLANGCGPNCGTQAGSCSPSGCASCSLSGGCGKR